MRHEAIGCADASSKVGQAGGLTMAACALCAHGQLASKIGSSTLPLEPPDSTANSGSPIEFGLGRNALSVLFAYSSSARAMVPQSVKSFQLNTGVAIPAVGLGCFMGPTAIGESEDVTAMVKTALDLGYRHFDTVQDAL
ncbi:hypothetical protein GSI_02495 [Ganoderma sinense ZZ0214-1]|uniref:NADP-dependent oxidoreductase domain-containing protein n=1 Tax=Ganoderma sinense ZZ0214-1 TaxID=1077348 RepID=A0A2G8SPS1_9APHY|nr:hypothetical protein GSI_02495 [Ganoderma sinense ZZ0214-1]